MPPYSERVDGQSGSRVVVPDSDAEQQTTIVLVKSQRHADMPLADADEVVAGDGTTWIRVDKVDPMVGQPRQRIDPTDTAEFAAGLASEGQIDPVKVRRLENGRYGLLGGERRWRSAKIAGLTHVKAIFRTPQDEREAYRLAAIDNVGRRDLHHLDEAAMIKTFQGFPEFSGLPLDQQIRKLAVMLCQPPSWVAKRESLNRLDPKVMAMLEPTVPEAQRLTLSMGAYLAGITDKREQIHVAHEAVMNGWSVKQAREYYSKRWAMQAPGAKARSGSTAVASPRASKAPTVEDAHKALLSFLWMLTQDISSYNANRVLLRKMMEELPGPKRNELFRLFTTNIKSLIQLLDFLEGKAS